MSSLAHVGAPAAQAVGGLGSCPWCGRPVDRDWRALPGRIECPTCAVQATTPWPTDAELDAAYGGHYRPASGRFTGPGDALLRRLRGRLARRIDRLAPAGPVLDVGAGDGALLDALRAVGREAVGLERSPTRPDVRAGELADLQGGWAAIVLWHSLEHLRAPGPTLEAAARRLAPGGLLVVAAPNVASLQARLFGERWLALDLPRHLTHIPLRAVVAKLGEEGLTVTRVSHWRGGQGLFGWLHGLVGLLPGRPHLYDAIRRPEARSATQRALARAGTLAAAVTLLPIALSGWALELAVGQAGSMYVEARHG